MGLTYPARLSPDAACVEVLEPIEWRVLRCRFEPKNRSKKPPTIRQAVRWIAQLGGFLERKGDGEPGLKTLWHGIGGLHHLIERVQLASRP
jgi:Transposase Tn5 dimerisation domain